MRRHFSPTHSIWLGESRQIVLGLFSRYCRLVPLSVWAETPSSLSSPSSRRLFLYLLPQVTQSPLPSASGEYTVRIWPKAHRNLLTSVRRTPSPMTVVSMGNPVAHQTSHGLRMRDGHRLIRNRLMPAHSISVRQSCATRVNQQTTCDQSLTLSLSLRLERVSIVCCISQIGGTRAKLTIV